MKLYCNPISPYARKAMILARIKDIDLIEASVTKDGANGYTAGDNPAGKIPALEREGHVTLMDSPVICDYLDSLSDPILPQNGEARWTQLRLHALGDAISDATYNYRYETVRDAALHWPEIIARHDQALRNIIGAIAADVEALCGPWEFGNLAIICGLDYCSYRAGHIDWRAAHPPLAKWHAQFAATPVWKETYAYHAD
ncbi:glutathione S-transferase family protein [Robiginitomaculum antarcticum]|uniref:glutathione S-transferase family protein n=1 Tax=Robiginitomaculum antarcticum TaxID=437507 RepID=UPI000377853F|nr:glutathione S-transferase family protein [Robiginitomaculum antarcticum]